MEGWLADFLLQHIYFNSYLYNFKFELIYGWNGSFSNQAYSIG